MKKILIAIVITVFGLLPFSSCKKSHPRKIATIDSLVLQIDSAKVNFIKINKDTIEAKNNFFKNSLSVINTLLSEKPESNEMNLLQRWGQNKKPFKNFLEKRGQFVDELEYSKSQLNALRESIKSNDIPKDSIDIYLNEEKIAAKQIIDETNIAIRLVNKQILEFDTLKPQINQFIDKYTLIKQTKINKK